MLISNTGFLCGYFSSKNAAKGLSEDGWQRCEVSSADRANLNNYYFPEFAQCMADDIKLYRKPLNTTCSLHMGDSEMSFQLGELRLWEAPFHIILYAVTVQFEQVEFNEVTRTLNALRNCAYYDASMQEFITKALQPVINIYQATTGISTQELTAKGQMVNEYDLSWLVESGNKFKLFQIIQVPEIESGDERLLLYDAGTLSRHTPHSTGINSPSYIEQTLSEHIISVFAGWSGLALLDTFTLLSADTPERVRKNWEHDYFEKIYIYQLFRKVFLYSVNLHYSRRIEDAMELEQRLNEFEQKYSYTAISYNFLPNIILSEVEKSLNTQRDYDQLNRMISKEIETRRDKAEEKTNHFLTFLTCLTIFSAIYDFASLINDSFGYETLFPNGYVGFRLVGTSLLIIILIVYIFLNRKK